MSSAQIAVERIELPADSPARRPLAKLAWHWRNNPKRELWLAWYAIVAFYQMFFIVFFLITRAQPPGKPWWNSTQVVQWFDQMHNGLLWGFAVIFLLGGMSAFSTALIAYSMRRMSVSPAFAYSYLIMYSLAAVPGMLLLCVALTAGALRPDRDPELIHAIFDLAFVSFVGTMGVFLIGSVIWMVAILLDKNRVFPKWFAYLNLCNALTEVVIAPACIFKRGVFSWNGQISWWLDMVVFGIYTGAFIGQLRTMILREDFGTGPLPDAAPRPAADAAVPAGAAA